MKRHIFIIFLLNTCISRSQIIDSVFQCKIETIYISSLREESGMKYVKEIISDTNNVVISLGQTIFSSKGIELGVNDIFGWEAPQCNSLNEMIQAFSKTNRYFEFPITNDYNLFDIYSMQKVNIKAFDELKQKYKTDFTKKSLLDMSTNSKINFANDVKKIYGLSVMDSLLIIKSLFNEYTTCQDLNMFLNEKKVYYLRCMDNLNTSELERLVQENKGRIVFSKKKFSKTFAEMDMIEYKDLPRKIRITDKLIISKTIIKNNVGVFVKTLHPCYDI